MTVSAPHCRSHPGRGYGRTAALLTAPLALGLALAACGPSPVDMVEYPVTTTPSRVAGQELQRAAEPENSCAPDPAPAEFGTSGDREVPTVVGDGPVEVPRSPERILALGAGAVDVACALGLQDLVVGTSGLPLDADVYLPPVLVDLPEVDTAGRAAADLASAAQSLSPDLIVVADDGLDPASVTALGTVAPTVAYDADARSWAAATEAISDAYGRPRAGGEILLGVIDQARRTDAAATPADTRVSLVSVTGPGADDVTVQDPDTLGSLMLEAVQAGRPPAQRTRNGERVPPLPESPPLGDDLDGDVIFAVVGGSPGAADDARKVFEASRWNELEAVGARRIFVVDRAVWEGAGPVAARAVLEDIRQSINGIAPDG